LFVKVQASFVDEHDDIDEVGPRGDDDEVDLVLLNGASDVGTKLLKFFIGATILDGNGRLQISRRALAEFADLCGKHSSFELWADPDFSEDGLDLTIKWHV
jgi:hypothetical protein